MTIRNRLTLFIFIISVISSLIAGGIVLLNASFYLKRDNRDSLKALESSFTFLFNGYIEYSRSISEYTASNIDIVDYLSGNHSIMAYVSKRAAQEELDKFINENITIANAYIVKDGNIILGEKILDYKEYGEFIIKDEGESALYKLETLIEGDPGQLLVTLIDLTPLIRERLNGIRINEGTHFFIFDMKYKKVLIHTNRALMEYPSSELENNKELKIGLMKEGFNSYYLQGTRRMGYTKIVGDTLYGTSIPYSSFNFSIQSLIQIFIASVLVLVFIIVVVSFFASHYVTKPLREMAKAVKDISHKKYDSKIPVRSDDEVGIVSRAINSMSDEIQNYTENLESLILDRTAQLQEALVTLERISITDDLTGLYNRRHFNEHLGRELARLNRSQNIFSIIFFDLDNFKEVNDTFGHKVGDEVLINTGEVVRTTIRETDIPARWGGEEFVILLNNTDMGGAFKLSETLRIKLSKIQHPVAGIVTGSFGCTQWTPGDDLTSLLNRCDKALYISKDEGRNRTTNL